MLQQLSCTIGTTVGVITELRALQQERASVNCLRYQRPTHIGVQLECLLPSVMVHGGTAALGLHANDTHAMLSSARSSAVTLASSLRAAHLTACVAPFFGKAPFFNFWLDYHFAQTTTAVLLYRTGAITDALLLERLRNDARITLVNWTSELRTGDPGTTGVEMSYYGQYLAYSDCVLRARLWAQIWACAAFLRMF